MTLSSLPEPSPRIVAARAVAVAAIQRCVAEGQVEERYVDSRTRRAFDVTWSAMRSAVVDLTRLVRDEAGADLETTMQFVKDMVHSAAPALAPHNAIRSAVVGWSVATFHEGRKRPEL